MTRSLLEVHQTLRVTMYTIGNNGFQNQSLLVLKCHQQKFLWMINQGCNAHSRQEKIKIRKGTPKNARHELIKAMLHGHIGQCGFLR